MIVRVGVLLLSAVTLRAQIQPEARAVLEKVAATYNAASEYYIEIEVTPGPGSDIEKATERLSFRTPEQYREEVEIRFRGQTAEVRILNVSDALKSWQYRLPENVYEMTHSFAANVDHDIGTAPFRDPIKTFPQQNTKSIRVLPEERIQTPGGETLCLVIEVTFSDEKSRMWIEKFSSLVWKWEYFGTTYLYKKIELHPKLPDSTFQFTPPAGARRVDSPDELQ
jgi:outer membrane lipoprotein-sorting protein